VTQTVRKSNADDTERARLGDQDGRIEIRAHMGKARDVADSEKPAFTTTGRRR